jgi:hypothetical protein
VEGHYQSHKWEFFTKTQVRTKTDTLKKRYKIYKEKKSQSSIGRSEAISHIMMWLIDYGLFSQKLMEFQVV